MDDIERSPETDGRHPETAPRHPEDIEGSPENTKIPWHFWVGVALVSLYLVYRFIQLIVWGIQALKG